MFSRQMTEIEQAYADGYAQAQNDAAVLFGMLAYEQANAKMIENSERYRAAAERHETQRQERAEKEAGREEIAEIQHRSGDVR